MQLTKKKGKKIQILVFIMIFCGAGMMLTSLLYANYKDRKTKNLEQQVAIYASLDALGEEQFRILVQSWGITSPSADHMSDSLRRLYDPIIKETDHKYHLLDSLRTALGIKPLRDVTDTDPIRNVFP